MLIALTGLHGVGKSYFANNILAKYGFKIYNKKELLPYICKCTTGRDDWRQWYREEFERDAEKVTALMLSYINLSKNVVIDSVHSPLEWNIISSKVEDAELVGIIAPEPIRKQRRKEDDKEKDVKRISHWNNVENECLMSNLDWVFNGGASLEINEQLFIEFLEYVKNKENILSGECMRYNDSPINKLNELMEENSVLRKKLVQAEQILNEFKAKSNDDKQEEKGER